jgi:hypothetical protein
MAMLIRSIREWSIGTGVGADWAGAGMVMPGMLAIPLSAGAAALGFAAGAGFLVAGFLFAEDFECAGMVMPGMSICAYAGAAAPSAIVEQSKRGRIFTRAPRYGKAPPAGGRGHVGSAIAVLAGARVAAAAGFGGAAALAIRGGGGLAVGHSWSPF